MIRTRLAPAVGVGLLALVAASLALMPGVAYWDTAELQAVAPLMGTAHPTGFPTYVLLGWLASVVLQPFGEPAFRMNLFSALCLAVAAGVTVDLVRALTGWTALGIAAGIAMALTPIAWAIGTHAEAHSLHLALVAILLWLLVAWDARARAPRPARAHDADVPDGARAELPDGTGGELADGTRAELPDATGAELPDATGAQPLDGTGGEMPDDTIAEPPHGTGPEPPDGSRVGLPDSTIVEPLGGGAQRPETAPRTDRGDRYLVAAAVVFGLAVGNHSLTLLLAIPVGLYVLAVDPRIWRRGRLVLSCAAALAVTIVLVYLELPLRAGPFRAALVYGTPNTWEGFKYIVLAEQFQGSLDDPFGELPRKFGELVSRVVAQYGLFAALIPIAFVATAFRRPRYALLTGSAAAITCFFNASYVNADINRYYLGPALMAWTWLAILAAAALDVLAVASGEPVPDPAEDMTGTTEREAAAAPWMSAAAIVLGLALLMPTLTAIPDRYAAVDARRQTDAATWTDHVLAEMAPDSVIVSWWSYSTPLWYAQRVQGRRPDITIVDDRTRLDENLGSIEDVIDANLGKRPVYVMRLDQREVRGLAQRYDLEYIDGSDASALTRVIGRSSAALMRTGG